MNRRLLALSWALLLLVGTVALAVGSFAEGAPRTDAERAARLGTRFACPVCDGESVAESSAPVARNIRAEIRRQVDAGRTDDEIADLLAAQYGEQVLFTPPSDGLAGLVWILPVVATGAAGAGLAVAFMRWRDRPAAAPTDDDRRLVAEALGSER